MSPSSSGSRLAKNSETPLADWLRELRFLLVGIAAGAILFLNVSSPIQQLADFVPATLCTCLALTRWPRIGPRLAIRAVLLMLAVCSFLLFEIAVLHVLEHGPWDTGGFDAPTITSAESILALVAGASFVVFSCFVPCGGPKTWGIRFGLGSVLFAVFFIAVMFAHLRQATWLTMTRSATWASLPKSVDGSGIVPSCQSLIHVQSHWHPFSGWVDDERSHVIVEWCEGCDNNSLAGPPATQPVQRLGGSQGEAFENQMTLTQSDAGIGISWFSWKSSWGDPFAAVEAFASDESVAAWTEDEFLRWIGERDHQ